METIARFKLRHHGVQLVISIWPLPHDTEGEIDLAVGNNFNRLICS
jgi:hypothetical protein